MRETGTYQKLGDLNYFVPYPLPPTNPPFIMDVEIMNLYGEASFALGQLNEMSQRLPDAERFIRAYVIKEALLSSAIEGIHTTLAEILNTSLVESERKANKDTQLVINYTRALDVALSMLTKDNTPLSSRIILKAHDVLMSVGEGDKATPGIFRKQSVRVEEFLPPPHTEVGGLMSKLEKYIHNLDTHPPLIKAGLVHVHFETIHPFLDGNGRIGRLLIVLMLIDAGLLQFPILYLSYYFKKHHLEYYQRLDKVRTEGDFEGWIKYYLKAIRDSSLDAYKRAKEIEALEISLKEFIKSAACFNKMRDTTSDILRILFSQPIITIMQISEQSGKAYNTVHNVLKELMVQGLVQETIIHKRNKIYKFVPYIALLEKDYE